MPNSTQFMQEMTSKDQNSSVWTKQISLTRDNLAYARFLQGSDEHLAFHLASISLKQDSKAV